MLVLMPFCFVVTCSLPVTRCPEPPNVAPRGVVAGKIPLSTKFSFFVVAVGTRGGQQ